MTSSDHLLGPADAPLTLVEYGDFECPDCGNAMPVINELRGQLGERLRFVFRNFPLHTIHAHASVAAQAAEAAAAQGKFWEMHELLYRNQKHLADVDLTQYALKIGLEIYRFQSDLSSGRFARRVQQDYEGGVQSGVKGTPTFFVNGVRYRGDKTREAMLWALEEAAKHV